jgi:hypothetical protein
VITISYYKKPLKEVNWNKLLKKLAIHLIHVIGLTSLLSCTIVMSIAFYCFIVEGGIIFYEPNLFIAFIELFLGIFGILYAIYLFINLIRKV